MRLITKRHVEAEVDRAERSFQQCWDVLADMREGRIRSDKKGGFATFQPRLAKTLYQLSSLYRSIEQEKLDLIKRKQSLNLRWFGKRMALLAGHQRVIDHCLELGQFIGDGFAWLFYSRDSRFIHEHRKEPAQRHAPPGIGGAGEVALIETTQVIGDYFVLFHGITNMLRLGDASLIDLRKNEVVGLAEFKSRSTTSETMEVAVIMSALREKVSWPAIEPGSGEPSALLEAMSAKSRERLNRQMKRMSKSLDGLKDTADKNLHERVSTHFEKLEGAIRTAGTHQFTFTEAGPSRLFAAVRLRQASLYRRLTRAPSVPLESLMESVPSAIESIVQVESEHNAVHVHILLHDRRGRPEHVAGMTHPIWWPIDLEAIHEIVFMNAVVVDMWNPSHLRTSLENEGFEVAASEPSEWVPTKVVDGRRFELHGMTYFVIMIQGYLQGDDVVLAIVNQISNQLPDFEGAGRIELQIQQDLGAPLGARKNRRE